MSQIAELLNVFLTPLQTYAASISGQAYVVNDLAHAYYFCQRNESFPLLMLTYTGDDIRGDFETAAINRHADLDFTLVVSRNRGLTADRAASIYKDTGNAIRLFEIVETARNIIRYTTGIQTICEWPVDYKGTKPWDQGAFISDAFKIDFSCAVILPDGGLFPQVTAP